MRQTAGARLLTLLLAAVLLPAGPASAQGPGLPPRAEGEGPYARLILRGATVIDGTGAPAAGPVDVVIEGNRIADVVVVGAPGVPIDPADRPKAEGGREIDVTGMYVLPGFIDLYTRANAPAEYVAKLWLGHGITTIRDPHCTDGFEGCLELRRKSAANEVTLPRYEPDVLFGSGGPPLPDAAAARQWVAVAARHKDIGIRFRGQRGDLVLAALEEAERLGVRTSCHHYPDTGVRETARRGLDLLEHWHGLPEALFTDRTVPDLPPDFNALDEQQRFAQSGRLWKQAAPPGSEAWNELIRELAGRGLTLAPTLSLYEANRDLMRAAGAEWHRLYTLPSVWDSFTPDRTRHAAHFFSWTTDDEIAWRENYRLWLAFVNDYKNRGGRVAVASDAGFMYNLHGFSFVREMELLREAGFHGLEVIRAATLAGAEALGRASEIGSIAPGKLADLVIVAENPLVNLKVLYGTGALKVGDDNRPVRTGGVRYTVKDGIVYDAVQLRADVRRMVAEAWAREGRRIALPGLDEKP
jgi:hypothetical protein